MSRYRCAECEETKDKDLVVCHEHSGELVCDDCWNELQEGFSKYMEASQEIAEDDYKVKERPNE